MTWPTIITHLITMAVIVGATAALGALGVITGGEAITVIAGAGGIGLTSTGAALRNLPG